MAESKSVMIVPLNESNYPMWQLQCRMTLMRDSLWGIVNEQEVAPAPEQADRYSKFVARSDRALATIVLSIDPSLLYIIGDPKSPVDLWKLLSNHFQKKSWANRLALRRKLHSLRLREGQSVQEHVKIMTEVFSGLAVVGDAISEEDRVVYLLASLPESFDMLVTAFEASNDIPTMETVIERLRHEEKKRSERGTPTVGNEEAMVINHKPRKGPKCHFCKRYGHIQRFCREKTVSTTPTTLSMKHSASSDQSRKDGRRPHHKANSATTVQTRIINSDDNRSESDDDDEVGLVVTRQCVSGSKSIDSWIIDSGASSHMCNKRSSFSNLYALEPPLEVKLGDGRKLMAVAQGTVSLKTQYRQNKYRNCKLYDVLYVPSLSSNLVSVSKATERGNKVTFSETSCVIRDAHMKPVTVAPKDGGLYRVITNIDNQVYCATTLTKEDIWHRRYGHLNCKSLRKLAQENLIEEFDYSISTEIQFCETCVKGKQHRNPFPGHSERRADEPLELVYSDVCGKLNSKSLGGAEYFLTFVDDKTRYVWIYVLRQKSEVFKRFCEWKAFVELSTGRKLKVLRTDNGGEYTSDELETFLREAGVKHELTIPKCPQQNSVAERLNRTLLEMMRSMLLESNYLRDFGLKLYPQPCISGTVVLLKQ